MASFASSYIKTSTVAVTRNADVLSYSAASNIVSATGTGYCEYTFFSLALFSSKPIFYGNASIIQNDNGSFYVYDGTLNSVPIGTSTVDVVNKLASKWSSSTSLMRLVWNGTASADKAFDGTMGSGATFTIGQNGNNQAENIRNVKIWSSALPDATLVTLTT